MIALLAVTSFTIDMLFKFGYFKKDKGTVDGQGIQEKIKQVSDSITIQTEAVMKLKESVNAVVQVLPKKEDSSQ